MYQEKIYSYIFVDNILNIKKRNKAYRPNAHLFDNLMQLKYQFANLNHLKNFK